MKKILFILSAVLALASSASAGEPPALVAKAKQKCPVCGDDCKCEAGSCPGKCPVKAKGDLAAAYAAVAKGSKVTLCVGVACIDGAYSTGSVKGIASGVYDCYKAADGTHLMQIRQPVAAGYPAASYGLANPVLSGNCPNGQCQSPTYRRR